MNLSRLIDLRITFCVLSGIFVGVGFSSCASTDTRNAIPETRTAPSAAKILAKLRIEPSSLHPVKNPLDPASIHYLPVRGHTSATPVHGNDLSYYGGPVQTGATQYNILVNCSDESCWSGKISQFESDLFSSDMFKIIDQYSAGGSYQTGGDVLISYPTTNTLLLGDIYTILETVISSVHLH